MADWIFHSSARFDIRQFVGAPELRIFMQSEFVIGQQAGPPDIRRAADKAAYRKKLRLGVVYAGDERDTHGDVFPAAGKPR